MAQENVIETHALTRRFGAVTAVSNLDLVVPVGSIYGFLGPNGAGKTTTIRLLLGLIRPDAGEIGLFGAPLARAKREVLRRVGALVENPSLYPHLTGWENLEITQRLLRLPRTRLGEALSIVGLEGAANRRVSEYSLGMRQRLGLALALLGEVKLLILDEPTNGLDPAGIHEMRELIRQLAAEHGITVFLSSHLLSEVEQVATHLGIIHQGRMIFQGQLADLHSQLHRHVALGVNDPGAAGDILAHSGWTLLPGHNGHLRVAADDTAAAARITAQLVAAGIAVFHVSLERPSLEDVFLKITEGAPALGTIPARMDEGGQA